MVGAPAAHYLARAELEVVDVPGEGAPLRLAGVGGEPLAGALTWYSDEGRTQELSEGDALGSGERTLWWRFVPADPNYSAAEGSVSVSVAAPPAPSRPSFPVEVVAVGGGSASASPLTGVSRAVTRLRRSSNWATASAPERSVG